MLVEFLSVVAIASITIVVIKELFSLRSLSFYKRQGVKSIYVPFSGITSYKKRGADSDDQLEGLQNLIEENAGEKVIAINSGASSTPYIIPIGRELVKELFHREKEVVTKTPFIEGATLGFFDHSEPRAFEMRGLFKRFFQQENMEKISPKIQAITESHIKKMRDAAWGPGADLSEWKEVSFGTMQRGLMADIVELILLEVEEPLLFKGKRLSSAIVDYMGELRRAQGSLVNSLTFGLAYKWQLLPVVRRVLKDYEELEALCFSMYKDRLAQTNRPLGVNVMDFIVQENRGKPAKEQWTSKDIIGNINLFQAAGAGTSLNFGSSVIVHMGEDHKMQQDFRDAVKESLEGTDEFDPGRVLDSPRVDQLMKEMFRMFGSSPYSTPRVFTKNCKLAGVSFRKGDRILIPFSIKSKMQVYYDAPQSFQGDRFRQDSTASKNKIDYIPFGTGHRNCIGQWLAKLIEAAILGVMVTQFEIDSAHIKDNFLRLEVGYGVELSKVKLRPLVK